MANTIQISDNDYILANGQLVEGSQAAEQIRALILIPTGSYKYDPTIGSGLVPYMKTLNTLSSQQLSNMMSTALNPLTTNGTITNLVVTATVNPSGDIGFNINCNDNSGNPVTLNWLYADGILLENTL